MPVRNIDNAIQAAQFRIKFKDIFNLKEFYRAMHDWLEEYDWSSVDYSEKSEKKDHYETLYVQRDGPAGAEHWWWWRLQKVPMTGNKYFKYHLDLDFHTLAIQSTEVMREGKKMKANKGEVDVNVYAYIEFDVGGKWSTHPFLKLFHKVFPNRIYKKDIFETRKIELYREAYILQDYIKKWFKLKTFLPYEEVGPFYPSHAYPKWKSS